MYKKTILIVVFDGFADAECATLVQRVNRENRFQVKTIALTRDVIKSKSGFTIVPDLDFIQKVDLKDIDSYTTAMLLVQHNAPTSVDQQLIDILTSHCTDMDIPVMKWGNNVADERMLFAGTMHHYLAIPAGLFYKGCKFIVLL